MNKDEQQHFYELALAVRRLFHKLGDSAAVLHADLGVSAGMRAVLESVIEGGPQTVPEMARARPVSRQHIQTLVNGLLDAGYVEYTENPAHKRSRLVAATASGREVFRSLRARETDAFRALQIVPDARELASATAVLTELISSFESPQWQAIVGRLSTEE